MNPGQWRNAAGAFRLAPRGALVFHKKQGLFHGEQGCSFQLPPFGASICLFRALPCILCKLDQKAPGIATICWAAVNHSHSHILSSPVQLEKISFYHLNPLDCLDETAKNLGWNLEGKKDETCGVFHSGQSAARPCGFSKGILPSLAATGFVRGRHALSCCQFGARQWLPGLPGRARCPGGRGWV